MSNRTPEAGKHDYSGSWDPVRRCIRSITFSVGIFQWIPKSRGRLKKGKVIARIVGSSDAPSDVYAEAERCCDLLDAGESLGFKKRSVWR